MGMMRGLCNRLKVLNIKEWVAKFDFFPSNFMQKGSNEKHYFLPAFFRYPLSLEWKVFSLEYFQYLFRYEKSGKWYLISRYLDQKIAKKNAQKAALQLNIFAKKSVFRVSNIFGVSETLKITRH